MNVLMPIFIVLSVSPLLAAGPAAQVTASPVTWSKQVAPLLAKHCQECHRLGDVAPFPLESYEDARKRARQIAQVTARRFMPPWKASQPVGVFQHERRLTEAEIGVFARWASAGAPQGGDFTSTHKQPEPPPPDLVATMPQPFEIPAEGPDLYQCIAIPVPAKENRWVRAIDFRPGNRRVVHHAIVFAGKPDQAVYPCFGAPGFLPARGLGGWSPGNRISEFPAGTAALLPAGSQIVLQIHYHPSGRVETDQSSVALYFADTRPSRTLMDIALGSNAIDIPAGAAQYQVRDHFTLPVDVELLGVIPHMHYVGKAIRGIATTPQGVRLLIQIDDWDFNWQDRYWYGKPIRLPAGTKVEATFTYDNSTANIRNPSNPPQRVTWGLGVNDEMAGLHLQVVAVRAEDAEELGQALWGKMMRTFRPLR
jgi:hypothetical protein